MMKPRVFRSKPKIDLGEHYQEWKPDLDYILGREGYEKN